MRDKSSLHKDWYKPGMTKIVFPDGECGCDYSYLTILGRKWRSTYWGTVVEVTEMSEDGKTCWVEEVK